MTNSKLFYVGTGKNEKIMRFSSFLAVDVFCKEKNIKYWSMVGMRSKSEMIEDSKIEVTA